MKARTTIPGCTRNHAPVWVLPHAKRPLKRPRSFDERDVLAQATRVFRSKGYDGVTIDDLLTDMGVGRPSLYSVFGDKRTLFLRVLKLYAEAKGAHAAKALFSPTTLRDSLSGFLRHAVESATDEAPGPGCLLVCVAPLVERRFSDAISAGELPPGFPAAARATQVVDLSRGLTVRAQMGIPRKTLLEDAEEAAELMLLPWRENVTL